MRKVLQEAILSSLSAPLLFIGSLNLGPTSCRLNFRIMDKSLNIDSHHQPPSAAANEVNMPYKSPIWPRQINTLRNQEETSDTSLGSTSTQQCDRRKLVGHYCHGGEGGNEHLQGDNNIATYILMVLDKLGPGHLGRSQLDPRQLGPRQLGPGAHYPP